MGGARCSQCLRVGPPRSSIASSFSISRPQVAARGAWIGRSGRSCDDYLPDASLRMTRAFDPHARPAAAGNRSGAYGDVKPLRAVIGEAGLNVSKFIALL